MDWLIFELHRQRQRWMVWFAMVWHTIDHANVWPLPKSQPHMAQLMNNCSINKCNPPDICLAADKRQFAYCEKCQMHVVCAGATAANAPDAAKARETSSQGWQNACWGCNLQLTSWNCLTNWGMQYAKKKIAKKRYKLDGWEGWYIGIDKKTTNYIFTWNYFYFVLLFFSLVYFTTCLRN